ncbi:MAG: hypothetical protein WA809_03695 [Candidatus Dormiibacterota bacterium]
MTRYTWGAAATLLPLTFVGIAVGRVWSVPAGVAIVALGAVLFTVVMCVAGLNAIRWSLLVVKAGRAKRRLGSKKPGGRWVSK